MNILAKLLKRQRTLGASDRMSTACEIYAAIHADEVRLIFARQAEQTAKLDELKVDQTALLAEVSRIRTILEGGDESYLR